MRKLFFVCVVRVCVFYALISLLWHLGNHTFFKMTNCKLIWRFSFFIFLWNWMLIGTYYLIWINFWKQLCINSPWTITSLKEQLISLFYAIIFWICLMRYFFMFCLIVLDDSFEHQTISDYAQDGSTTSTDIYWDIKDRKLKQTLGFRCKSFIFL